MSILPPGSTIESLARDLNAERTGNHWRCECPACHYAVPTLILKSTPKGASIYCVNGCVEAAVTSALQLGVIADVKPSRPSPTNDNLARLKSIEAARIIRSGASPIKPDDLAGLYLIRRGLAHLIDSPALRFRTDCTHPTGTRIPAMIAEIQDALGMPVAVHRTYLAAGGYKARIMPTKAAKGPMWGSAIRLYPVAQELVVGEGIETAASAGLLLGLPAWAAISAGNLAKGLVLPKEVQSVVIAADDDGINKQGKNPGIDAAESAFRRWKAEGREVRIFRPLSPGIDFNDVLLSRQGRLG